MIVCHCHRVNERAVAGAVAAGCASLRDLRRHCGASGGCGMCAPTLSSLLSAPILSALVKEPADEAA